MNIGFRKTIKLGFLNINISKSGIGISIGGKGIRFGVDSSGKRYSHYSIPKTGFYSRNYNKKNRTN